MTAAALAVVFGPLGVACAGARGDSGPVAAHEPVTGVEWRVDSVTTDGTTLHAPAAARLRIDEDGRAAGNLGCNQFSAQATVQGDRITFGGLRTTRMACDNARMTFERALARALGGQTLTGTAEHGTLVLTTGHGERVRLTRSTPE
ncbi:META domain-containing protein [Streptomyces sp. NPDC052301]|uniref:META domain-containing protein n=1 Tax=Streptomyces sp. NPDC052301 TaxID=3365687 RepID=UPI0037D811BD